MSEVESNLRVKPLFVVALASSAGGLSALTQVVSSLPFNFLAAVVIVQHMSPRHHSYLAEILNRRTSLKVKQAEDHEDMRDGVIYVAPPDWHVLVNPDSTLSLSHSERHHFLRPSADILFKSLANGYKDHAIAVVLTGTGGDGSEGIKAIKEAGGIVIVQDDKTAEFPGMPSSAIQTGYVDHILPLSKIGAFLENLIPSGNTE